MPKPLKLRKANEIVGLFILLSLGIVLAAVLLGPRTERFFTPARTLAIHLPPEGSLGLREGADVQILGSVVGTVDDIVVSDSGEMEALVSIRGNFIRFVRTDSKAIIRKPLGIGEATIEITRGKGNPLPLSGGYLECVADKAPTQIVEETVTAIRDEALPAIKEVRGAISEYTQLAADLRAEQAQVREAVLHVNNVGAALDHGDGLAGMLLHDPAPPADLRAALPKINASIDQLQATLADTRKFADRLPVASGDLQELIKNLRATSDQIRQTSKDLPHLQRSAEQAVDSVPGLILQIQETARQIERLTEAMQRNWLIRGDMDHSVAETRIQSDHVGTDR